MHFKPNGPWHQSGARIAMGTIKMGGPSNRFGRHRIACRDTQRGWPDAGMPRPAAGVVKCEMVSITSIEIANDGASSATSRGREKRRDRRRACVCAPHLKHSTLIQILNPNQTTKQTNRPPSKRAR